MTNDEEVRYGIAVADLAAEYKVRHLVYSSSAAVDDEPSGVEHFDTKIRIEAHVRTLPIAWTIIRPATSMEMLVMPGLGLDEDRATFFPRPDHAIQFVAAEDIGRIVAAVFADPILFEGKTFEVARDELTGADIGALLSQATGRDIAYSRSAEKVLAANPLLAKLTALLDKAPLAGHADVAFIRTINSGMLTLRVWIKTSGQDFSTGALLPFRKVK